MGIRILAHHAHICPQAVNPEGTMERLLQVLDACGIEQAVCFAPFAHQLTGLEIEPNSWLASQLRHQPRLFGFGTVDLASSNLRDQVRRIVDLGLRGIKLHPNAQRFAILSKPARQVYEAAQDLDLFVSFHTGVHESRMKDCDVLLFDEVAHDYPRLRFSLEHMGGYHFFNQALAVLFNHYPPPWKPGKCRIFAGLASVFTTQRNRFWHLTSQQILEIIAQTSIDQVIFGLDFPYNQVEETRVALEVIHALGLPEHDLAKLLGDNLRRELGIS